MSVVKWGIIGPGAIAHNFATALQEAENAQLVAVAGRNIERLEAFGAKFSISADGLYPDHHRMLDAGGIDAVYIATPHPFHAQLAIEAMRLGHHVLCEKPAGISSAQVVALTEIAEQTGRFWAEGLMYRHHPQITRLQELLQAGTIGEIQHIEASFGFEASTEPTSRLMDPELGGGAIFDVGIYPLSLTHLIAGMSQDLRATGVVSSGGVDLEAHAVLRFEGGVTAHCATSIRRAMANTATITGSRGRIHLPNPWTPGRNAGPSDAVIHITNTDGERFETLASPKMLFTFEATAASRAILAGEHELAACSWRDSIALAKDIERWRLQLPTGLHGHTQPKLSGVLPQGLPELPKLSLPGLVQPISQLILGCDNQENAQNGAILWDAWWEAGGNAFDTAFVYGGGSHEAALGSWLRSRGVGKEAVVIAKGAHTPLCLPEVIEIQLEQSMERLGLDYVPVYIMHRDNLDVPVDEFVDALNRLKQAGKIGMFGGSNWQLERFIQARTYALANGLEPLRILNNNLSLAVMERPVWAGCLSSNVEESLAFLEETETVHLAWSSQARGYFLPDELRNRLPAATSPEHCFGSAANQERRRRAEQLASERGVYAHQIATAWVLSQPFPSLALIGPRSAGELATTLPALTLSLTAAETAWLNLTTDQREQ